MTTTARHPRTAERTDEDHEETAAPKRKRQRKEKDAAAGEMFQPLDGATENAIDSVFRTGPRVKILSLWYALMGMLSGIEHYIDGKRVLLDFKQVLMCIWNCSDNAAKLRMCTIRGLMQAQQIRRKTVSGKGVDRDTLSGKGVDQDTLSRKSSGSRKSVQNSNPFGFDGLGVSLSDFERHRSPGQRGTGTVVMEFSQIVQLIMATTTPFGATLRSLVTEIAFRATAGDHDFLADIQEGRKHIPDDVRLVLMSGYERTAEAKVLDPLPDVRETFPEAPAMQDVPEAQEAKAADFLSADETVALCRSKYGLTMQQTSSDHYRPMRNAVAQNMPAEMIERAYKAALRACGRDKQLEREHEKAMALIEVDKGRTSDRDKRLGYIAQAHAAKEATKEAVVKGAIKKRQDERDTVTATVTAERKEQQATAEAGRSAAAAILETRLLAEKTATEIQKASALAELEKGKQERELLLRQSELQALQLRARMAEDAREAPPKERRASPRALKAALLTALECTNAGKAAEGTLRAKCSSCDLHRACFPSASVLVRDVAGRAYPDIVGAYCVECAGSAKRRCGNAPELRLLPRPKSSPSERLRLVVWVRRCGLLLSGKCEACLRNVEIDTWHCAHDVAAAHGGDCDSAENRHVSCSSCNTSSGTRPYAAVIADGLRGRPSRALHAVGAAEDVVAWIFGEKTHLAEDLLPTDQQWHASAQSAPPRARLV